MKTQKMSLASIKGKLSRAEMKKIMAGEEGPCQENTQSCNSVNHINCCSGLVCASFTCQFPTVEIAAAP